jgi:HAD superfamily hydrolase (TIGR01509 family)
MKNAWLFIDFDNTLMGTEAYVLPSLILRFNRLYASFAGRELSYSDFQQFFPGLARESLCTKLSQHFNISVDCQLLYKDREWEVMQHLQSLPNGVPMAENVIKSLTKVSRQKIPMAMVSNNSIQRAMCAMRYASNQRGRHLAQLFGNHFFEAQDEPKPKPTVYLRAMAQLRANPRRSFAVEDSPTGVTAATAAGMVAFGYTGFAEEPSALAKKLLSSGCVATFGHWEQFPQLFEQTLKDSL